MNFLSNLTLARKLIVILASCIILVALVISSISLWLEAREMRVLVGDRVNFALAAFAEDLPREAEGFAAGDPTAGAITTVLRTQVPVAINASLVDKFYATLGVHVTYFRFLPERQEFERVMTSIQAADGTRAVGTLLDPTGPAKAALLANRVYTGQATILGSPYVTRYEPVFDKDGRIAGAVFAGVSISAITGLIVETLVGLAIPTLVLVGLALLASQVLIRKTLYPIKELVEIVKRLENREYDVSITLSQNRDELSDLSAACIRLRDELREGARLAEHAAAQERARAQLSADLGRVVFDLREGLAWLADGDLVSKIPNPSDNPFPADYDPLRESFNVVIDRFGEVINQVNVIARSVRDSAVEITGASGELSSRAETQAATLEQSAAALTELTQSVAATAERATQAQDVSVANRQLAERGADIVRQAVTAMQGIEKGSDQITRIISVIEDIAFQTNLLALNAGVEAARAGDAGRGFAVVASEVRLLAQRASESAREIKILISDSTERVGEGATLVSRTGDSLSEILGRANDASSLAADIATAAVEQARGLAEVNAGVNQLDHVTQQNTAVAEETSAAAATLQARSEDLILALAGFRTRERPQATKQAAPRPRVDSRLPKVEANVVDWAPAAAAAANGPRANPARPAAAWAEF